MSHQVTVRPSGRQFTVEPSENILDAALRQGVVLAYGCKNGACGSCKARVLEGSVEHGKHSDTALTADAASDAMPADTGPVWVAGKRKLSGAAFFFDAKAVGAIEQQKDVTGATAYLLEFPEVSQPVALDGSFTFSGLPEGGEFTLDRHDRPQAACWSSLF